MDIFGIDELFDKESHSADLIFPQVFRYGLSLCNGINNEKVKLRKDGLNDLSISWIKDNRFPKSGEINLRT